MISGLLKMANLNVKKSLTLLLSKSQTPIQYQELMHHAKCNDEWN